MGTAHVLGVEEKGVADLPDEGADDKDEEADDKDEEAGDKVEEVGDKTANAHRGASDEYNEEWALEDKGSLSALHRS